MAKLEAINWNDMEWENVRPGIRRKVFHGENCSMAYNAVEPGHEPRPHSHPYEQIAYITDGEAVYNVGSTAHKVKPGSVIHIPSNIEHFIEVTGPETCINIDFFVPRRADYKQSNVKGE